MDDVDRANDWVTLKSLRYGKPRDIFVDGRVATWVICAFPPLRAATDNCPDGSISRSTHSRNGVLVGAAIETNFHPPIRTAVINAGVWQTLPLVSVTSHRDPRRINAIFDHVTSHSTGARRRQLPA